jgi:hypothetical protein
MGVLQCNLERSRLRRPGGENVDVRTLRKAERAAVRPAPAARLTWSEGCVDTPNTSRVTGDATRMVACRSTDDGPVPDVVLTSVRTSAGCDGSGANSGTGEAVDPSVTPAAEPTVAAGRLKRPTTLISPSARMIGTSPTSRPILHSQTRGDGGRNHVEQSSGTGSVSHGLMRASARAVT